MPSMNGTELHRRLHEELPDLKVLFMTGYRADMLGGSDTRDPARELIMKPFTGHALASRVRGILDRTTSPA